MNEENGKKINWKIAAIFIAVCVLTAIVAVDIKGLKDENAKATQQIAILTEQNTQMKSDLNQVFTNQKALEANQLGVKQLSDTTNANQRLAERFFDNMIIELILTNDLKTTGEAYKKHQEDLNNLKKLGYFDNGGN